MSLVRKFFPKQEVLDNLTHKELEQLKNLVIGDLICIPLVLVFTAALIACGVIGLFDIKISFLIAASSVFFIVSISLIKSGHVYLGSYFATFGFLAMTFAIVFFAPTAESPYHDGTIERSTFVSYRTGVFCCVVAVMNFFLTIRYFQILVFLVT